MLNYIRSNKISLLLLLPVLAILLWEQSFREIELIIFPFDKNPMPLYQLTVLLIPPIPFLFSFFGLVLVLFNSFLITRLNKKYMLIEARTYLPALIYIIYSGIFIPLQVYNPVILASTFVLLAIDKVFNTYYEKFKITDFFDASFFIAIASLFYFNVIYLILFIWIRIINLGRGRFKTTLVTITGLVAPYFFTWSFYYLNSNTDVLFSDITSNFSTDIFIPDIDVSYIAFFVFSAVLIFLSSIKLIRNFRSIKINIRKYFISLFWIFLILLLTYFSIPLVSIELFTLIAIPISFLLSYYLFNLRSKFFGNVIIVSFLILIIFIHIFKYLNIDIL